MQWQPAQPTESGLAKAGRILLLVGAIMGAIGAAFLVLAAIGFTALEAALDGRDSDAPFSFIGILYGGLAVLVAVSAVFAFLAYGRANRGDWHGAWVFGLVASLLPPLQVVPLLGAIFCYTCPEHEAQRGPPPPAGGRAPPGL